MRVFWGQSSFSRNGELRCLDPPGVPATLPPATRNAEWMSLGDRVILSTQTASLKSEQLGFCENVRFWHRRHAGSPVGDSQNLSMSIPDNNLTEVHSSVSWHSRVCRVTVTRNPAANVSEIPGICRPGGLNSLSKREAGMIDRPRLLSSQGDGTGVVRCRQTFFEDRFHHWAPPVWWWEMSTKFN